MISIEQEKIDLAIRWLTESALVTDNQPVGERGRAMNLRSWNGAIRGEYLSSAGCWESFCPIWHTGQAVKALVMQNRLESAEKCADFLLANQLDSGEEKGALLAFEDSLTLVSASAMMESLDGLFMLSEKNGERRYAAAALDVLDWLARKMWNPETGKFRGTYDLKRHRCCFSHVSSKERPLLDDAVFLTGWRLSGNEEFKKIAVAAAENLLREEGPDGNWVCYGPCIAEQGLIHPRQAFWWGKPMLPLFQATGDERYLNCFKRAAQWYQKALRLDGGVFRHTHCNFNTTSFGHAASGSACAAIVMEDYRDFLQDDSMTDSIEKALSFCLSMQFSRTENPLLKGAILEKVLPPDGTDLIPYQLRDLGTIFFLQAAARNRC